MQKAEKPATSRRFLSECSHTRYGDLAEEDLDLRDAAAWTAAKAANSAEAYEKYEDDFPGGRSADAAEKALTDLQAAAKKADHAAWAKARAADSIVDYQAYLKAFPEGQNAQDATSKIEGRQKQYLVRTPWGHSPRFIVQVAFSGGGRKALSLGGDISGENTLSVWDVASGEEVRKFEGVTHAVFSPDPRAILASTNEDDLKLWNLESGELLRLSKVTKYLLLPFVKMVEPFYRPARIKP